MNELEFAYLQALVREHCGIVLEADRQSLVEVRLATLLRREGLDSTSALVERLRVSAREDLHVETVEALANGETMFFRDPPLFDALRSIVFPALVRRRATEGALNVWSAACSTGQEPYSLALLLDDLGVPRADLSLYLLATDFSREALARSKRASYSQFEINRGLPARVLVDAFVQQEREWRLDERVRARVTFSPLNLVGPWPPMPRFDLVLLRNVMLYWPELTRREVLGRVRKVLREDGYLVLGAAESTYSLDDAFERVPIEGCCVFRLREQAAEAWPAFR